MMDTKFGDFIRRKRLERRIHVRELCINVVYWSSVERNIAYPDDRRYLVYEQFRFSFNERKTADILAKNMVVSKQKTLSDKEIIKSLPLFFCVDRIPIKRLYNSLFKVR